MLLEYAPGSEHLHGKDFREIPENSMKETSG
jgi:hypothetical protein